MDQLLDTQHFVLGLDLSLFVEVLNELIEIYNVLTLIEVDESLDSGLQYVKL